ncbi:UNVERIFIED_CONTAM: hypothetical protein HHA_453270 [Hammondia hammondi]|eukprot:XP_008886533.1 hypothetical protein HHA_453270 [Hammondia hammondi]
MSTALGTGGLARSVHVPRSCPVELFRCRGSEAPALQSRRLVQNFFLSEPSSRQTGASSSRTLLDLAPETLALSSPRMQPSICNTLPRRKRGPREEDWKLNSHPCTSRGVFRCMYS